MFDRMTLRKSTVDQAVSAIRKCQVSLLCVRALLHPILYVSEDMRCYVMLSDPRSQIMGVGPG